MNNGTQIINQLSYALLISLLIGLVPNNAFGQKTEYWVKASFIEKFANYSRWPSPDDSSIFTILILGQNPFNGELYSMLNGKPIKGKQIKVLQAEEIPQDEKIHIIFVSSSQSGRIEEINEFANKNNILLISDTRGFSKKGTHINLYLTNEGKVHFEMNPDEIQKSGVEVNSLLYDLAKIVR